MESRLFQQVRQRALVCFINIAAEFVSVAKIAAAILLVNTPTRYDRRGMPILYIIVPKTN